VSDRESRCRLHEQGSTKDSSKAQAVAYKFCKLKGKLSDTEQEGLSDFVNLMVEKMAAP
jgi:hypothetical protein